MKFRRLSEWFAEASHLRSFALANVWFWLAQHPITIAWYILKPKAFGSGGVAVLYLTQISIAALWLSSLAWWQSTRVEERQIEAEASSS